jgi:curved DNA-binding protein CbpA
MDVKFVDYYKVLDIDINASAEIIRITYLQLAKKNHPDQGGNAEKFQLISEAYECLYNKNNRKSYDLKYLKKNYDDLKEDEFIKFRNEFKEFEQMNKKSLSKEELHNLNKTPQNNQDTSNIDIKQRLNDISIERDNQDIELKDDSIKNVLELNNLDINDIYEYNNHIAFTGSTPNPDSNNIINLGTIDLLCNNINKNYSLITVDENTFGSNSFGSNSLYTCIDEFDANNKINKADTINKIDKFKELKINKKATSKLTSDKIEEYIMNRKKEEEEIIKNFECITKKISK